MDNKSQSQLQNQPPPETQLVSAQQQQNQLQSPQHFVREEDRLTGHIGGEHGIIRQSRIKDRPIKGDPKDSAVRIKIELDLEVEVDLYARVKGDVTIGLM